VLVIVFGPEILAGIVAGLPELVPVLIGGGALVPRFAR
jgi:hypothetical protein